jgi:hypothetical protein
LNARRALTTADFAQSRVLAGIILAAVGAQVAHHHTGTFAAQARPACAAQLSRTYGGLRRFFSAYAQAADIVARGG